MKKILLVFAFIVVSTAASFAQQVAYVNSGYVLQHIPEYTTAQKQLDDIAKQWQDDVDKRYADIEKVYQAYQNDQSVLSAEMRRRREDEIVRKEKEVKDYQKQKFGFEGDLYKRRTQLLKPIQDRVAKAIQEIAAAQGIDLVLDKSSETTFLYANPKADKSNDVIIKLGYKPNPSLAN